MLNRSNYHKSINHQIEEIIDSKIRRGEIVSSNKTALLFNSFRSLEASIDAVSGRINQEEGRVSHLYDYIPIRMVKNAAFELWDDDQSPTYWNTGGTANGRSVSPSFENYIYGSRSLRLGIGSNTTPGTAFISQNILVGGANVYTASLYYYIDTELAHPFFKAILRDLNGEVIEERFFEYKASEGTWHREQFLLEDIPEDTYEIEIQIGFSVDVTNALTSMYVDGVSLDPGYYVSPLKELEDGTVDVDRLQANSVSAQKIQSEAIESRHIKAKAIQADHLSADSVTAEKIKAGEIESDHISANAIKTVHLDSESVTSEKIKANQISTEHISADGLDASVLTSGVINAEIVEVHNINADEIKLGTLDASRVNVVNIDASNIKTGTLDASEIDVKNLSASSINTGELDASLINVINLSADVIESGTLKLTNNLEIVSDAGGDNSLKIDGLGIRIFDDLNTDNMILVDSKGLRISTDGGSSWDVAISPQGIVANAITVGSINTDVLVANVINAINSEFQTSQISEARIEDLSAEKIKTGSLSADVMSGNVIHAINAYIGDAVIDSAKIGDLTAEHIRSGDIDAERMRANVIDAINAHIGNAVIDSAKIGDLNANKITAGDIDADRLRANVIQAINSYIGEAVIDSAKIEDLDASKITTGELSADVMTANVIDAINAYVGEAVIDLAKIGEIDAGKITTGELIADVMIANVIDAINAHIGEATIDSAKIEDLDASKITSGDISTDRLRANVIDAINAYVGSAVIDSAKISDLDASKIKSGVIDTEILSANVVDAINAYLGDAVIDSAKIGELNAEKITSGNIHTDRLKANVIDAINLSTGTISTDRLSVTGVIEAINADGSSSRISAGKIVVQAQGGSPVDLTEFFTADNNETRIYGGHIATGTISASQLSIDAFGDSNGLNLVRNSNFVEDSNNDGVPDFWETETFQGIINRSIDTTTYVHGHKSVKFSANIESSGTIVSEEIEVNRETLYTISGYIRTELTNGNASLEVVYVYEDNTTSVERVAYTEDNHDWKRFHAVVRTYDNLSNNLSVKGVRIRCRVDDFVGDVWFDAIQFEKGSLLSGYMPREMTETQIGPGIIRTHHISTEGLNASVITGGDFVVTNSLVLRTSDDRVRIDDTGMSITGGALRINTAPNNSLARLVIDSQGIRGYKSGSSLGFHLRNDGTAQFNNSISVNAGDVTINNSGITVSGGNNAIRVLDGGYIFIGDATTNSGTRIDAYGVNVDDVIRLGGQGLHLYSSGSMTLEMTSSGLDVRNSQESLLRVTHDGDLTIRGTVYATDGEFVGTVKSNSGYFGTSINGVSIGSEGLSVVGGGVISAGNVKIKSKAIEVDASGTNLVIGEYSNGRFGLKFGDTVFDSQSGILITGNASINLGNGKFLVDSQGNLTASSATIHGSVVVDSASIFKDVVTIESGGRIELGNVYIDDENVVVVDSNDNAQVTLGRFTYDTNVSFGILAGDAKLDNSGLTIRGQKSSIVLGPNQEFQVDGSGHLKAVSAVFGNVINVNSSGLFHGSGLGAKDSAFGIGVDGEAYFRGVTVIDSGSTFAGDVFLNDDARILVGDPEGKRVEISSVGLFGFDSNNIETFAIDTQSGEVRIVADAIEVLSGRVRDTLYVGGVGSHIRIGENKNPVINLYHPDSSKPYVLRLAAYDNLFGLYYSTDGSTFYPALTGEGINANAITDGNFTITDTDGHPNGLLVRRREIDYTVTFSDINPFEYARLKHKRVNVLEVWNQSKSVLYEEGKDYTVNQIDGMIARSVGSSIPQGATVLVTYDWNVVDINSADGILVQDGNIQVENDSGVTLIGGGFVRVKGLDVGVFQSDNFITNGDFTQTSTAWGTAQTNDGKSLPGFDPYPPGEPFFGDWYMDRLGNVNRYGAAFWIPSKSDTTYDSEGNLTGYANVSFAPTDFLHKIYGYANLEVGGETHQWAAIEQDVYPIYNYSNNPDHILPGEQFEDVVFSAGFHWHADHSSRNEIRMEVDELVPNYVFVESDRTSKFTPVWDNVHDEYEGLKYYGSGWFEDDSVYDGHTGDNIAYDKPVSSNAQIVQGTEKYAVDNDFLREDWATRTLGSGSHYLQVDLGKVQPVNEIMVWHSREENRRYRNNKVEVSEDGVNWETIFEGQWLESHMGKSHRFPTKNIRYVRDWINGYDIVDVAGNVVETVHENQWIDIQVRHKTIAITDNPGDYIEWEFVPHSRANLWVGFVKGPGFGIGHIEINGVRVATFNQGVMIGDDDHDHPHYHTSYVDVSSQEDLQIIPRKKHTIRIVFSDIPENQGKKLSFNRIKLEDFRTGFTTSQIVASEHIRPVNPYGFHYPQITPNKAMHYLGTGRQTLKGMYDNPANFSRSGNCWIRYRLRIISERSPGGGRDEHDHVMITGVVGEFGTKRTKFRRSSLDTTPSQFLQPWVDEDHMRHITGVHTKHLADGAVTDAKIASVDWSKITNIPDTVGRPPLMSTEKRGGAKLGEGLVVDTSTEKLSVNWAGSGGNYGTATTVARGDHRHKWTDITDKPSTYTPSPHEHSAEDIISGTLALARIPSIPHTKTLFADQQLLTSSNVIFNGVSANSISLSDWALTHDSGSLFLDLNSSSDRTLTIRNLSGSRADLDVKGYLYAQRLYINGTRKDSYWDSKADALHSHDWNDISNPPETATRWGSWNEITSKPFNTIGNGLTVSSGSLRVAYGGTGSSNSVARSDHNHDNIYAKLSGATVTGSYVFTKNDGVVIDIDPQNPNRSHSQTVKFDEDVKNLDHDPIVRGSVSVSSGSTIYKEGTDYSIDYLAGTIERLDGGGIAPNASVSVSYEYPRILFRTAVSGATKFSIDSDGNIKGSSITVQIQASEETSGTTGSFTVEGDLNVSGNTTLGDDPSEDSTSVRGSFTVYGNSGVSLSVNTSGDVSIPGLLNVNSIQVDGKDVAYAQDVSSLATNISNLESTLDTFMGNVYTKNDLSQATSGTFVHWNTLTNKPSYATRWPSWSEVTNKPSQFTPEPHSHNASDISGGKLSTSVLPVITHSLTDFSNQELLTTSSPIFNGATFNSRVRVNDSLVVANYVTIGYNSTDVNGERFRFGYNGSSGRLELFSYDGTDWVRVMNGPRRDGFDWFDFEVSNIRVSGNNVWHQGNLNINEYTKKAGDSLTGSLLWSGNQQYKGIYWGSKFEDGDAHNGSWGYIRQGDLQGQLEIGSYHRIAFYETDTRDLVMEVRANDGDIWVKNRIGIGRDPSYSLDVTGDVRWSGQLRGGTVPWARLSGVPDATAQSKGVVSIGTGLSVSSGVVSVNLPAPSAKNGWENSSARSDHFHEGLENAMGYGVIEGFNITPSALTINVSAGKAILYDGYLYETSGSNIDLELYVKPYTYVVIVALKESREHGSQYTVIEGPSSGQGLPLLPEGVIPLAKITMRANTSSVNASDIVDIRRFTNLRWVNNALEGYGDYVYDISTNTVQRRSVVWRLDSAGRLTLYGDGVATNGGQFVDVSGKYQAWDAAAEEQHRHVWNERPTRISSTVYRLTHHVRFYGNSPALQLYVNGLYRTPGVDYTVTNNEITFTEAVESSDIVVANYVRP